MPARKNNEQVNANTSAAQEAAEPSTPRTEIPYPPPASLIGRRRPTKIAVVPLKPVPKTPPKPRSAAQIEASRVNGAKSRGPVTIEGKRASSRNNLIHGRFVQRDPAVMDFEDDDAFKCILRDYTAALDPQDRVEFDYVYEMACQEWWKRRIRAKHTRTYERLVLDAGPNDDYVDAIAIAVQKDPQALNRIGAMMNAVSKANANKTRSMRDLFEKRRRQPGHETQNEDHAHEPKPGAKKP